MGWLWAARASVPLRGKGVLRRLVALLVPALVLMAWPAGVVARVLIVTKRHVGYSHYMSIQLAVNAARPGDWILVDRGVYPESVRITKPRLHLRGLNRNGVIVDGRHRKGNGIEVYKASGVWIENLTVRNFDRRTRDDSATGNEIWWNGGAGSNKIGAQGWFGSYLTAYDTGLNGSYGIFTNNETEGSWDHIYASGFNDSGIYVGACQECKARITGATMEDNALGYSGSNSGGKLAIEWSLFRHNSAGVVPNSENPGDGPPPQDGECNRPETPSTPTPTISSTKIPRCSIIRYNLITENNNLTVPVNGTTARAGLGAGVILPGDYADLVEKNIISNNSNDGVFGIEYPNPFTPPSFEGTIFFQLAGNRISNNVFLHNGYHGGPFTGDVTLASGASEIFLGIESQSKNNCVSGNLFTGATFPAKIQEKWGCQNNTTPNPGGAPAAYEYILAAAEEAAAIRKPVGQPAPPAQPTMPNPCQGVPKNPLCS